MPGAPSERVHALLNRTIEGGRTPATTAGAPRVTRDKGARWLPEEIGAAIDEILAEAAEGVESLRGGWVRLHAELYNAALQERIEAYRKAGLSISYYDQQNTLPAIKAFRPELVELGSHALQETLRRLDRAFQAFFRRVKAGQSPGFPRFKSSARFSGFTYPDPAGWKLLQQGPRGGTLRLGSGKGAMMIRMRGRHRFAEFTPNDLTLSRRRNPATGEDQWYASITLRVSEAACARQRTGEDQVGIDFGLAHWANFDDGRQTDNPRWLRESLPRLADLQRQRARKKRGSHRYHQLSQQIARLHQRIADRRRDFIHKQTSALVQRCALIATEALAPQNMSRSARGTVEAPGRRVRQKAGLNREILSAGLGMAHQMLTYKAQEAEPTKGSNESRARPNIND